MNTERIKRSPRRLGRFSIGSQLLNNWNWILPTMAHFVIIDARYRYDLDVVEYVAFSPLFEEIEEGVMALEYSIITNTATTPATVTAERKQ